MKQVITESHWNDGSGNPAGGISKGLGIDVLWQNGPMGKGTEYRGPNGAFVEGVIQVALGRLRFYQDGKFKCRENALAITKMEEALHWLQHRTEDRKARGVEGTHEV